MNARPNHDDVHANDRAVAEAIANLKRPGFTRHERRFIQLATSRVRALPLTVGDRKRLYSIAKRCGLAVPALPSPASLGPQPAGDPFDFHPLANLFPLIADAEASDLAKSIADNGLREPIVLFEGQILDGRNRFLACREAGVEPRFENLPKDTDPLHYVVDLNLRRRHLDDDQRRMVAAELSQIAKLPRAEAAEIMGTDVAGVDRAKSVLKHGAPELTDAVKQGTTSVAAAAEIARLSPEVQRAIIAEVAAAPATKPAFQHVVRELRTAAQADKKKRNDLRRRPVEGGGTVADLQELVAAGYKAATIMADPPWPYETWSEKGADRSAIQHYDTMSIDEIAALPIGKLAADDAILHLWTISTQLPAALRVIAAWGFTFKKIGFIWTKTVDDGSARKMGNGKWTRDEAEVCLLATRGNPQRLDAGVRQTLDAPLGEHSEKPDEFRQRIERLTGGPYLELFGRKATAGWTVWGNQVRWNAPSPPAPIEPAVAKSIVAPVASPAPSPRLVPPPAPHRPDADEYDLEIPTFLRRGHPDCTFGASG